jgi:signal transduction histidine kinase
MSSVTALSAGDAPLPRARTRGRLFLKYVGLFVAVVSLALVSNGLFEVWFSYQEHKAALVRIQREQAEAGAAKLSQFFREIEGQLGWTTQLPWSASTLENRRFDALRLLRQVPAITELSQLDASGKEQLRVSRLAMDVIGSGSDYSNDPKRTEALARKVYYGPVYFRRESEPYMTLAVAGTRRDAGVSVAEVNLKLIAEEVSSIKVGERGHAYVVAQGRLIAHPDISLVLRNTDMRRLPQVQAALDGRAGEQDQIREAQDTQGRRVLSAYAKVPRLDWFVFVELPVEEAYAPLYTSVKRSGLLLLAALFLAALAGLFLARRMVVPIQALRAGAERLGGGDLAQRISVKTGDELEALANQFNDMAGKLQESYADLEKKVEVRTEQLTTSLQQQTATAEVLKVISRSTFNLQPVLDAIVDTAARLCGAENAFVFQRDGDVCRLVASQGFSPEYRDWMREHPISLGRGSLVGRTMVEAHTVHIPDCLADPEYVWRESQQRGGFRTMLGVPLLREGTPIGVLALCRTEVAPFNASQIELVTTFADQAVIAIENVRLFDEVQARTRELSESLQQQTATADVLKVISRSAFDLQTVLDTLVESASRLCGAEKGVIFQKDDEDGYRIVAVSGFSREMVEYSRNNPLRPGLDSTTGRVALEGKTVHAHDVLADPNYKAAGYQKIGGYRTSLGVPLLREGTTIGVFVLTRPVVQPFTEKQIELVTTFADQAVIAIENARLFNEVQDRTRELSESLEDLHRAQDRLVQSEKLASLGQLTAGIAHEIKNPLNFVNNFAEVSAELVDELATALVPATLDEDIRIEVDELTGMIKGNLEKVVQHGRRADSIVKNMLLHSREGTGERRSVDLNATAEESLNLAYHGARAEKPDFNVTLKTELDPTVGSIEIYPQEFVRVLLNLISNGFYAAHKRKSQDGEDPSFEPTLTLSTKGYPDRVEIRVRDNGTGIPQEIKEKMFNPFFTTKPAGEGTGLGLSLSYDIVVKQHGGTIEVDTKPGEFTEFTIALPRPGGPAADLRRAS